MKNPIFSIVFITLLILGCEKEKTDNVINDTTDSKIVSKLDISNADYLVLKSSDNTKSTNSNQDLYKITIKGENISEEKVSLLDALGNEIDSIFSEFRVYKMLELKEGLICLYGSFELFLDSSIVEPQVLSSLVVRTSDGAIFDFNGHFPSDKSYYLNQNKIQTDKTGSVYYASDYDSENIFKLSETENGYLQEEYLPSGEEYFSFFIDLEGNCYYYNYPYTKVKKSEGGIATSDMYREFHCIWNTYDNKIMASVYDSVGYLTTEDDKIKFSTFASISVVEAWTHIYKSSEGKFTQVITPDISSQFKQIGNIIFEETREVFRLLLKDELFTTNQLVINKISGNYIFLSSEYSLSLNLYKIDLESFEKIDNETYLLNSYVTIDFPDDLEIKSYEFNGNGEIIFTALRLSDEIFVTGVVDSENSINILTESSDKEYNNLMQLN